MWRQQRRTWERPGKKEGNVRPYPLKIIQTVWHFRIQIVHPTLFCTRGLCWSSWIFFTSLASLYDGRFMPFNQTLSDFVARNATGGRSNIFRNGRFNLQFTVVCIHTLWISCCIILKLRDRVELTCRTLDRYGEALLIVWEQNQKKIYLIRET